ncbi:MAG: mechanosensitive ion channel family protein [Gammaproteobacteria bacterium]
MLNVELLAPFIPLLITLSLLALVLGSMRWWMLKNQPANPEAHLPRQLLIIACWTLGILLVLLSLPVSDATRGQLLSLLGLVLTALIALSSTTLVANAMAGLLLRIVNSFQPGDYIRVGDHFGRVSERGLFHTEVQTEDRDLLTLPNMHLITHAVTVVHKTGTIISATLTLGYDVHHKRVEKLLKQSAEDAELQDPFVHIRELGDYSISYRVGGRLEDIDGLITARSRLRACMLDSLHGDDIEIVSPSFMNQRPQTPDQIAIPKPYKQSKLEGAEDSKVEDMIFDKAEQASKQQQRRLRIDEIKQALSKSNKDTESPIADKEKQQLESELNQLEAEEAEAQEEKS